MNEIDKSKLLLERSQLEAVATGHQGILAELKENRALWREDIWNTQNDLSTKAIQVTEKRIAEIDKLLNPT